MEADSNSKGHSTNTNEEYPVHCTEELLLPFFTDYSLKSVMATPASPSQHPAMNHHTHLSPISDLRLVLLGRKGVGKSTAGNTILGAGFEFGKPTEECIKRRADVNGIKVTVVDTPGWEWYYPLNSTPNWVKRETLRSVTLCPPGAHAILLVVRSCASVNEDYIKEIEEHLLPLGRNIWEYTIVLFTRGDELGLVSMEQRIQTSPGLQKLLQKCQNRYHVMENRTKEGTQVKELIRKLKEMVEAKEERYKHLSMDAAVLSELEVDGTRRARERRKRQRQMEAQAQRGTIKTALISDNLQFSESDGHHSFSKTPRRLPEIRLVLLGERETGKSSAGNSILGNSGVFLAGTVTEECIRQQANVSHRHVTVVDTPGWEGGVMGTTPERVKREIVASVGLCPPGPHAFLLALRVDTAVRESHICNHLEMLGEDIWRYTILLFTHCDQLREGVSIEKHIQKGGKELQMLLEKCTGRYHAMSYAIGLHNSTEVTELLEKVEKMATTNRCEAFSGLVQEVKTLTRQKNEKYSQRLKELQEKMLRQEAELKKLREREMKSLRWFFERKKKSKSAGNLKKEEEEDEEKRNTDQNIEELEERMRLMIEDKEREIIDLNVEHERILAELHKSKRESEDAGLKIEMKEREVEELNERADEQQSKILDLERTAVGHEQEKQQCKEAFKECENIVQKLQQNVKMAISECAEWKEKATKLNGDLEQTRKCYEDDVEKLKQEKEIALNEFEVKMSKIEILLREKETEVEQNITLMNDEKQKALDSIENNKQEMLKKLDEMICQHKKQLDEVRLLSSNDVKDKISEMDNKLEMLRIQHFEETEEILKQHQTELNEKMSQNKHLKDQLVKEANANLEIKQRELAAMEQKYCNLMNGKSKEFEIEKQTIVENQKQEMYEKDEEIAKLNEQIQDNLKRQKIEIEKMREDFVKMLEEKEKGIATMQLKHEEELKAKMSIFEKQHQTELNEKMSENKHLKDQLAKEANANLEIKQRELAAMEQKYCKLMNGKSKEFEIEKQTIVENQKQEMYEKDEEIAKRNEQIQDNLKRQKIEIEKMREDFVKMLEEKEKEIATMQLKHEEELKAKMSIFEKDKEQHFMERDKEILELKCKYTNEINGKNKEIEKILKEKGKEMEKLVTDVEELKQKQMEELNSMADRQAKLQEREQEIFQLKEGLKEEETKLQEFQTKKDQEWRQIEQKLVEKEQLIQMLNEKLKEIEEMLQKKDNERGQVLLTQKKEAELQLEFRNKEIDEIKQKLSNEIEKNSESKKLVEKLTNEIVQIQNEAMLKDEEYTKAVKMHKSCVQEIEELKNCVKNYEVVEEGYRNKEREMEEKLAEKDSDCDQMRLIIEQTKAELNELTQKMEREMTSLIQEYERSIERRNQELEIIVKEKNEVIKSLQQEKQQKALEVMENLEDSQKKVEEMEGKMAEEIQKLEIKCKMLKEEYEEKDEQFKLTESKLDTFCKKYKQEILELGQINSHLQKEKEDMKKDFERQLAELAVKLEKHDNLEQKLKETENWKNEKQNFEEQVLDFERRQEELVQWEVTLTAKQNKLDEKDCERQKYIEQKEKEFEKILEILEEKQKELSFHGQDLQKKVRGLKDQGKELKDKEFSLKNQEQELINWTSELNAQNKHVSYTTQQLNEMGRELASLKQQLQQKDQKYRLMFNNLNKWEVSLQERETQLSTRQNQLDYTHKEEEFMYQDIGRKDRAQKMAELACPKGNNCHFETLHEIAEENESLESQNKQEVDSVKVINDFKGLSKHPKNYKEASDLTILMLRESWSARSPSGVNILAGKQEEMSQINGGNFRYWRGEIEGREVSIVEPQGVKWQDCTNTSRENIREAVTWCESEPDIMILVLPVFLTCTESYRKAIEHNVNLVASDIWDNTVVLFTWGETLGVNIEQHIQRNGEHRRLIEKCKGRYHVLTSKKNNSSIVRLFEKMNEIVAINKRDDLLVTG